MFFALLAFVVWILFIVLGWAYLRGVRRGKPLSAFQRKMLFYGSVCMFGVFYVAAFYPSIGRALGFSYAWVVVIICWLVIVMTFAVFREKHLGHK